MQLSDREIDIIACTAFDASLTVRRIGEITGYKQHIVRKSLDRLVDDGAVFLRPYINPYALGLTEFLSSICVLTPGEEALHTMIDACVASPFTTYVTETAGEYHLSVRFLAASWEGVTGFFDSLCERAPGVTFRKTVQPAIDILMSAPRLSTGAHCEKSCLRYGQVARTHAVDELDRKILGLLGSAAVSSHRQIAQACGAPPATIEYRLRSLREKGILLGVGYYVPAHRDNLYRFTVRIVASRPGAELRTALFALAENHPAIGALIHTTGQWDYDLTARLSNPADIAALQQELHGSLEKYVAKIDSLLRIRSHKMYLHPEDFDLVARRS